MRIDGIKVGDIVEVDRLGRRFHALVTGNGEGALTVEPFDNRITYRSCRAHDVRTHWAKRGRPRGSEQPRAYAARADCREPSLLQMELDSSARS